MTQPTTASALPLPAPEDALQRLVLVTIRRMGTHGLYDAQAALLAFERFGLRFRLPLTLLRAYLLELASTSTRPIALAPCCAARMTHDEDRMLTALIVALSDPCEARQQLQRLCGNDKIELPFSVCQALSQTLTQLGHPLIPHSDVGPAIG